MLLDLLNWMAFAASALIMGHALIDLFLRISGFRRGEKCSFGRDFAAGVLFLTTYSEIVSLFHAVDLTAFLLLCVIVAVTVICCVRRSFTERTGDHRQKKERIAPFFSKVSAAKILIASGILLFFLILSALRPTSYDDYLYHVEALEWIEKYGVVPGLANLHGRFGFNSSFLCLSALFSWSFCGRSLHALNALLAGAMTVRCVLTLSFIKRKKVPGISDLLKLCCLIYIAGNTLFLSGADTDPSAMLATLYCFIRYAEIHEDEELTGDEKNVQLSCIAVFSFFACTLKLSAAPAVLITVEPLIRALRKQNRGLIAASALGADFALIPFLIRNVILTGWILYPFSRIDLFDFDFKVPASLVDGESQSVILWGRSTMNLIYSGYSWQELVDMSVTEWAPIWFNSLSTTSRLFVLLDTVILPIFLIVILVMYIRKSADRPELWKVCLTLIAAGSLLYWFFSAPSERFGGVYLLCIPACVFGTIGEMRYRVAGFIAVSAAFVFTVLIGLRIVSMPTAGMIRAQFADVLIRPADYESREMDENEMKTAEGGTVIIYTPENDETDQGDYIHFPSAPSSSNLKVIEMRGGSLKEGFRRTESD